MKHLTIVLVVFWQYVSVVFLHDFILESEDGVSRGSNNDVLSVRFHDVSNKSQMKHPTAYQVSNEVPDDLVVVRSYQVSQLHCRNTL